LTADRSNADQFAAALGNRSFDLVVDMTLYTGTDAEATSKLLQGRVGRYIMISTGQVYLVRNEVQRPFREEDYAGTTIPAPATSQTYDYDNWLYGMEKRAAEDALFRAAQSGFPLTVLRLPGVNSERDYYDRIFSYVARLQDGGPILVPENPHLALRHVYGADVVDAILRVSVNPNAMGRAYNISQEETVTIEEFLTLLAEIADRTLRIVRLPREKLERAGLLPYCSPFSSTWMSTLDNARSKAELGLRYTPLREYVARLVRYFETMPPRHPVGFAQREKELDIARSL
ncbi:MAG: NAD-dependent epimerase/dehydratase family protein, partial [Acidobacteriaceae bacterium]